ncbi:Putative metal-binding motif-containing protein [Nannocystis exedens]|uniref:Putative metal-binding motif-containing protein n=1 Tax=Nannocystis exedens TaxID=54 RepID=A0A1I1V6P2_9BACT|nr:lectin-like protein [Nannocystis exedens]PCC72412.1 Lectin C-type domain protein [Nannocystis exedens]SFD78677.1 Putative metal-binding motif-containing protein [Nannocystis exedens]
MIGGADRRRAQATALAAALSLACTFDGSGFGAQPDDLPQETSTSTTTGAPPATTLAPTTSTTGTTAETTGAAVTSTGPGPTTDATTTTTGEPDTTGEPCATPEPLYVDGDGDGFGDAGQPVTTCAGPGFSPQAGDCDDGEAAVFPGQIETCNVVDDDCDQWVDEFDLRSNIACGVCTYILAAGRLYAFCEGARAWSEARADCQLRGLDLAIDIDWPEHNLLVSYLAQDSGQWYLGAQDGDGNKEGNWRWLDGSEVPKWDGRFGPQQPDDNGSGDAGADCLALVAAGMGNNQTRWVDESCGVPHKWICEGDPPAP